MQIRRMLLEGSPVIVAMRPHESPSRWRMFCFSSARFRLTPLRRPRCLPVALTRQRSLPGQVALHLREYDGQVQHRPPHGTVLVDGLPEADDFDLVLPQPSLQHQNLGQRPAQAVQRRHLHTVARLEGGLQAIQPRPIPRGPAPHVLEDLLAVGTAPSADSPGCWRRRRWLSTRGRIRTVFCSSFAGPRLWHGGMMLRWAEFWLCWKASLSGRVCHHSSAPAVRFAAAIDTPVSGDVQTLPA